MLRTFLLFAFFNFVLSYAAPKSKSYKSSVQKKLCEMGQDSFHIDLTINAFENSPPIYGIYNELNIVNDQKQSLLNLSLNGGSDFPFTLSYRCNQKSINIIKNETSENYTLLWNAHDKAFYFSNRDRSAFKKLIHNAGQSLTHFKIAGRVLNDLKSFKHIDWRDLKLNELTVTFLQAALAHQKNEVITTYSRLINKKNLNSAYKQAYQKLIQDTRTLIQNSPLPIEQSNKLKKTSQFSRRALPSPYGFYFWRGSSLCVREEPTDNQHPSEKMRCYNSNTLQWSPVEKWMHPYQQLKLKVSAREGDEYCLMQTMIYLEGFKNHRPSGICLGYPLHQFITALPNKAMLLEEQGQFYRETEQEKIAISRDQLNALLLSSFGSRIVGKGRYRLNENAPHTLNLVNPHNPGQSWQIDTPFKAKPYSKEVYYWSELLASPKQDKIAAVLNYRERPNVPAKRSLWILTLDQAE